MAISVPAFALPITVDASTPHIYVEYDDGMGGSDDVDLTPGTYYPLELLAHMQTALSAQATTYGGTWTVSMGTGDQWGKVTVGLAGATSDLLDLQMYNGNFNAADFGWVQSDPTGGSSTPVVGGSLTGPYHMRWFWSPFQPVSLDDGRPVRTAVMARALNGQRWVRSYGGFTVHAFSAEWVDAARLYLRQAGVGHHADRADLQVSDNNATLERFIADWWAAVDNGAEATVRYYLDRDTTSYEDIWFGDEGLLSDMSSALVELEKSPQVFRLTFDSVFQ